ncbi:lactococcin 972 family bacteriocin [Priestia megaterium]|uniref:lactococcin 972 family bacteriocin n=1 Tax=Priestia megaterium TaxID=1404 RepID=UPI00263B063B|nr:lactococcin 972 family bacteriocin [Priestia megaterium]MDN4865849.1 lactococcin 972 family bacteriocin [Priestia megaterium]
MKKVITSLVLGGVVSVSGLTTAFATTEYVAGGRWEHSVTTKEVHSDYYHLSKAHKSSVQGTKFDTSGWKSRGYPAKSVAPRALSGNKAYYDVQ